MTHVASLHMLSTLGYKHPLRICNVYCLSTAAVVTRTRLVITIYVHCLPCSALLYSRSKPFRAVWQQMETTHCIKVKPCHNCLPILTLNSDLPERITLNKLVQQAVCFLRESFNNISVLSAPANPCTVVTDITGTAPLHLGV
jgi:hypothetical protein